MYLRLPASSVAEAVALVEQAAAERAELILLEVWPFVYDLPSLHARGSRAEFESWVNKANL